MFFLISFHSCLWFKKKKKKPSGHESTIFLFFLAHINPKEVYMSHTARCKSQVNCPALPNYTAGKRLHFAVLSIVCDSSSIPTRPAARLWQLLLAATFAFPSSAAWSAAASSVSSADWKLLFVPRDSVVRPAVWPRMFPDPSSAVVIQIV